MGSGLTDFRKIEATYSRVLTNDTIYAYSGLVSY